MYIGAIFVAAAVYNYVNYDKKCDYKIQIFPLKHLELKFYI